MKNVLFILPDEHQTQQLVACLADAGGFRTRSVRMPEEYADAISGFEPDLAVIDEQLPAFEMQAWSRVILGLSPSVRILDLSKGSEASRRLELGVHGYLREPFRPSAFLEEVRRVLDSKDLPLTRIA